MTSDELKNILPELQETDVSSLGLEDMLCSAYIYDALYNLVSVNGLDMEYGDRKIYGGKIRQLFEQRYGIRIGAGKNPGFDRLSYRELYGRLQQGVCGQAQCFG